MLLNRVLKHDSEVSGSRPFPTLLKILTASYLLYAVTLLLYTAAHWAPVQPVCTVRGSNWYLVAASWAAYSTYHTMTTSPKLPILPTIFSVSVIFLVITAREVQCEVEDDADAEYSEYDGDSLDLEYQVLAQQTQGKAGFEGGEFKFAAGSIQPRLWTSIAVQPPLLLLIYAALYPPGVPSAVAPVPAATASSKGAPVDAASLSGIRKKGHLVTYLTGACLATGLLHCGCPVFLVFVAQIVLRLACRLLVWSFTTFWGLVFMPVALACVAASSWDDIKAKFRRWKTQYAQWRKNKRRTLQSSRATTNASSGSASSGNKVRSGSKKAHHNHHQQDAGSTANPSSPNSTSSTNASSQQHKSSKGKGGSGSKKTVSQNSTEGAKSCSSPTRSPSPSSRKRVGFLSMLFRPVMLMNLMVLGGRQSDKGMYLNNVSAGGLEATIDSQEDSSRLSTSGDREGRKKGRGGGGSDRSMSKEGSDRNPKRGRIQERDEYGEADVDINSDVYMKSMFASSSLGGGRAKGNSSKDVNRTKVGMGAHIPVTVETTTSDATAKLSGEEVENGWVTVNSRSGGGGGKRLRVPGGGNAANDQSSAASGSPTDTGDESGSDSGWVTVRRQQSGGTDPRTNDVVVVVAGAQHSYNEPESVLKSAAGAPGGARAGSSSANPGGAADESKFPGVSAHAPSGSDKKHGDKSNNTKADATLPRAEGPAWGNPAGSHKVATSDVGLAGAAWASNGMTATIPNMGTFAMTPEMQAAQAPRMGGGRGGAHALSHRHMAQQQGVGPVRGSRHRKPQGGPGPMTRASRSYQIEQQRQQQEVQYQQHLQLQQHRMSQQPFEPAFNMYAPLPANGFGSAVMAPDAMKFQLPGQQPAVSTSSSTWHLNPFSAAGWASSNSHLPSDWSVAGNQAAAQGADWNVPAGVGAGAIGGIYPIWGNSEAQAGSAAAAAVATSAPLNLNVAEVSASALYQADISPTSPLSQTDWGANGAVPKDAKFGVVDGAETDAAADGASVKGHKKRVDSIDELLSASLDPMDMNNLVSNLIEQGM